MKERVNIEEWIRCAECGNEDIEIEHWGEYDDYRATVECPECGAGGYFD